MAELDIIGLHKAIAWEQAKGALRAFALIGGQIPSGTHRSPAWGTVLERVEDFITDIEDNGFNE